MRGWIRVISSSEITVIRRDDSVLVAFLDVLTVPLADAGTARVRQDGAAEISKDFRLESVIITCQSIANRYTLSLKSRYEIIYHNCFSDKTFVADSISMSIDSCLE